MLLMPCPYNTDEKSPQAASSLPKFTRRGHGPVKGPVPQIALKAGAGSQRAVHPDNTCCCGHKGLSAAGNEGPVPGEPGEACTPQDSRVARKAAATASPFGCPFGAVYLAAPVQTFSEPRDQEAADWPQPLLPLPSAI